MASLFTTDPVSESNYIKVNDGSSTQGWVRYNDGGASPEKPIDGTLGTPTISFETSPSTAIRGNTNFLLSKTASVNEQGQGISYTCNINPADRGKVLRLNFEYLVNSGTYVDGNLTVWFYNVTNSQLIQGAPTSILNSQLIERFQSEVQVPITCQQMRIIIHVSSSSTAAYTMRFDNFSFGSSEKLYSAQITDWIDYTPTFNSGFTVGTGGSSTWQYRKNGSDIEIKGVVILGSSGFSMGSGNFTMSLPSGLTMSSSIINGTAMMTDVSNTGDRELFWAWTPTTSTFNFVGRTDAGVGTTISATAPFTWGAGDRLTINIKAPITGWSASSQVVSNEYTGRVVAGHLFKTGNTHGTTTDALVTWTSSNIVSDTHGMFSDADDALVIKEAGYYSCSALASMGTSSGFKRIQILVDGVAYAASGFDHGASGVTASATASFNGLFLNVGQKVTVTARSATSVTNGEVRLTLTKSQGPSQVLAGESVNLRAVSATTTISTTGSTVIFSSKEYDSHGIYSTSTGAITIPSSGKYSFKVSTEAVSGASASVANVGTYITLFKGIPGSGVSNTMFDNLRWPVVTTSLMPVILKGSTTVTANAGDVFYIVQQRDSTVSSYSLSGGAQTNVLVVEKVGN